MRWFYMTLAAILALAIAIFALQNFQSVTVSFLNFRLSAPLAILIALIYLLGMVTGGSLWALIRRTVEGSRRPHGA
jgi:putative membrane protein